MAQTIALPVLFLRSNKLSGIIQGPFRPQERHMFRNTRGIHMQNDVFQCDIREPHKPYLRWMFQVTFTRLRCLHTPPYMMPLGIVNTAAYILTMNKTKFPSETWLAAGFRALTSDGPTAIRVEALARNLGATKGSFYWNFDDLPSFKREMLALWRNRVAEEIESVSAVDASLRLERLIAQASGSAPDRFGGRRVEPAMRSWALTDPAALAVVNDVDHIRLAFLAELLGDIGQHDPAVVHQVYGAYIGLTDLAAKGAVDIGAALDALLKSVSIP